MLEMEITYPAGTRVLLWRLEEEASQLLAMCRKAGVACEDLMDLPGKRQREKAAERLLLRHALGDGATLSHAPNGAPIVEGMNISISHTTKLVVLALNQAWSIGIDAEQADRQQVFKVRDKFLNDSEKHFVRPNDLDAHVIAWTAKEAVIKATRNSSVDWTDGICLDPFTPAPVETTITAHCDGQCFSLVTRRYKEHYLTLALPVIK